MPKNRLSTPRNESVGYKSFLSENLQERKIILFLSKAKVQNSSKQEQGHGGYLRCNVFSLKRNARSLRKKLIKSNFGFYLKKNFKQYTLFILSRRTLGNFEYIQKNYLPSRGILPQKNAFQKNKIRSQLYFVCDPAGYLHKLS